MTVYQQGPRGTEWVADNLNTSMARSEMSLCKLEHSSHHLPTPEAANGSKRGGRGSARSWAIVPPGPTL
jgi:hypothetical protein